MEINDPGFLVVDTTASLENKMVQWMMDHPDDPVVQEGIRSSVLFAVLAVVFMTAFFIFLYKTITSENKRTTA